MYEIPLKFNLLPEKWQSKWWTLSWFGYIVHMPFICKLIIKSDTHVIAIERGVEQRAQQKSNENCIKTWWTKWTIKRHKFIIKHMYTRRTKWKKRKQWTRPVNCILCSEMIRKYHDNKQKNTLIIIECRFVSWSVL